MEGSYIVAFGVVLAVYALDSFIKISEILNPSTWMWMGVIIPGIIGMAAMFVGGWKFKKDFWDGPTSSDNE